MHPRLLICLSLPLLLVACATPQGRAPRPADAPPPDLAAPCPAGPDYPASGMPLGELLDLVAQREAAASECRARQAGLVAAWPR